MYVTHEGLQHGYEVSCKELDFLVEKAKDTEGVAGSRMMGGGFGGCTINLVKADRVEAFIEKMTTDYRSQFGIDLPCHVVVPQNGVEILKMEMGKKGNEHK
jgi:galactokinase